MSEIIIVIAKLSAFTFIVTSMLAMGLSLTIKQIVDPLRNVRVVLLAPLANVLNMDDELPSFLHLPHLDSWRVLGFLGLILVVFLLALGAEVLIMGPDLRADGLQEKPGLTLVVPGRTPSRGE